MMDTLSYKTISANKESVNKEWVLVDADGQVLGRLATKVAKLLRGKYKTNFTPHVDCGDNVVVINAGKILITGNKMDQKEYVRHTEYPGGQRFTKVSDLMKSKPETVIVKAVKGMLPKNKLGAAILKNLYVYPNAEHKQEAQQPKTINLNSIM